MKTSIGNSPTAIFVRFILNCGISVIPKCCKSPIVKWGMLNVQAATVLENTLTFSCPLGIKLEIFDMELQ